jgi:hypothetical protein
VAAGDEVVERRRPRGLERAELGDGPPVDGDDDPLARRRSPDDGRDIVPELSDAHT